MAVWVAARVMSAAQPDSSGGTGHPARRKLILATHGGES
jgi:hypothetical protein